MQPTKTSLTTAIKLCWDTAGTVHFRGPIKAQTILGLGMFWRSGVTFGTNLYPSWDEPPSCGNPQCHHWWGRHRWISLSLLEQACRTLGPWWEGSRNWNKVVQFNTRAQIALCAGNHSGLWCWTKQAIWRQLTHVLRHNKDWLLVMAWTTQNAL